MGSLKEKINITCNPVYDFIASLARITHREWLEEVCNTHQIKEDTYLKNWVENTLLELTKEEKRILDFYFSIEGRFGIGLIPLAVELDRQVKDLNIKLFLNKLLNIDITTFLSYLLLNGYKGKEKLKSTYIAKILKNKEIMYREITKNFFDNDKIKWRVFRMLSCPEEVRIELVNFLKKYYKKIYLREEERALKIVKNFVKNKEKEIINDITRGISEFNTPATYKKEITGAVTYFSEISFLSYGHYTLVLGYRFQEFLNKILPDNIDKSTVVSILKLMADETRFKLLLELKKGPRYATQLANKFNLSNATINYHFTKFADAGLIKHEKDENKMYYRLKKDKIKRLISELERLYLDV